MLLVAVSGGIDSMCLAEKVRLEGGPFAIAHCNFCLRGADSDGDEAFVKAWASSYGIICHVKSFDTLAYADSEGISVEMAARRLRYHWFGELCRSYGYSAVAVAHNANDNAETLILNLLRGTGVRGLTGMKANGFIPDPDFSDVPLLRPLLSMTRPDIEAFAKEHGLSWREDATNALNDYKRNKIRNLVFPVFKEINPSFVEVLNRDMDRIYEDLSEEGVCSPTHGHPRPCKREGPADEVSGRGRRSRRLANTYPLQKTDYSIIQEPWDGSQSVKQPQGVLIMDADKAGEYVEGFWETGDWIKPLGAPGRKKMQDWFTDHHISADEKPFIPLLKSAKDPHHVLAVIPYCIDNSVKVTNRTKRIIRILLSGQ